MSLSLKESGKLVDDEQMLSEMFKTLADDRNGSMSKEEILAANTRYSGENSAMEALVLALKNTRQMA